MPKNPGSHRAEHRRKMHAMLFEAFSRLMETKGFDAINMATLAAEAGISRASVYYYFPDKEKLLLNNWGPNAVTSCRRAPRYAS